MRGAVPLVVAVCLATTAAAAEFDGVYKQAADSDCSLVGVDGGALKIAENTFHGVESTCEMTEPVNVNEMKAVLYTMKCTGKRGDWSARAMLVHAADGGVIMVWDGYAFKYDACPDPDAPNPVAKSLPADAQVQQATETTPAEPAETETVTEEGPVTVIVPDDAAPEGEAPDTTTEAATEADAG